MSYLLQCFLSLTVWPLMSVCWLIICMVEDCTNCTDILTGKYPDTTQNPCNLPKICNFFREPAIFWKESVQISSKFVQFKKSGHNPYTFKSPYTYNFLIIRFRFLVLTRFFVVCRFCCTRFSNCTHFLCVRICTIFFLQNIAGHPAFVKSACPNIPKEREVTLPCSCRSTYCNIYGSFQK